ncbi:non-ribosomal peptide synthetase, partial [Streptomyces sp. CB01881]|uniref:AMP-binding protein n=1 Tax=Streptomyces sp. CB01881 TaxID=2078691 RepID=UPI0011DF802D
TNFPVTLVAVPGSALGLQLIFDHHRLAPQDATTLLDQLAHLLTTLAGKPDTPVGELPLMTEQTARELTTRHNNTTTDYPRERSLFDQFTEQATTRPDAIALTEDDRHYTYNHLATRANHIATTLHTHQLPPDARIGIFLPRSRNLVHATLATLQAGAAYVPLDPAYPAERLSLMITDSRLDAILTDTHH